MDGISSSGGGGGDRQRSKLSGDASTVQWENSTIADAEKVDRISQLPHHVQHSILSFLPSIKDVVRTSVLSKSWLSTYTSFPINRFSIYDFLRSAHDLRDWELKFIGFVNGSLVRQCHQNSGISNVGVDFPLTYPFEFGPSVDHWIGLAVDNGVEYLHLDINPNGFFDNEGMAEKFYTLPRTIISANRLTVLKLAGWNCTSLTTLFDPEVITWPSLQKLHMTNCYAEDRFFDLLTFGCPLIEELLVSCYGSENFRLSGFARLSKLKVTGLNGMTKIEISVPSLLTLECKANTCEDIDLTGCENLEVLKFFGLELIEHKVEDLVSKLPALKSLDLSLHSEVTMIRICCQQLERLVFHSRIGELVVDAPRLQSFHHFNTDAPVVFVNPPNIPKFIIHKDIHSEDSVFDFLRLRLYLSSLKQIQHLHLWLNIVDIPFWKLSTITDDPALAPFPTLKHLELNVSHVIFKGVAGIGDQAVVDGLFSVGRPESLVLSPSLYYRRNISVLEVLCKNLMAQGRGDHCCSSITSSTPTSTSCWRHELKGYQMEQFDMNGDGKALTGEDLIESLPTLGPEQKIKFILNW